MKLSPVSFIFIDANPSDGEVSSKLTIVSICFPLVTYSVHHVIDWGVARQAEMDGWMKERMDDYHRSHITAHDMHGRSSCGTDLDNHSARTTVPWNTNPPSLLQCPRTSSHVQHYHSFHVWTIIMFN